MAEPDLVDKRRDYAEAGIPEYWIVDPRGETITVLGLRRGAYLEQGVYRRGAVAEVFDARCWGPGSG